MCQGAGWVESVLLTHNELSDLAKFYKDYQREFELQALLKMMKPCYPDLSEEDLRDAPWDLVQGFWRRLCLMRVFLPLTVRWSMTGFTGAAKPSGSQPSSTSTTTP